MTVTSFQTSESFNQKFKRICTLENDIVTKK